MKPLLLTFALIALPESPRNTPGTQDPPCRMVVVSCNYAYLYTGTVAFKVALQASEGRNETDISVAVDKGVAICAGTVSAHSPRSASRYGTINGRGLVAVEFEPDSTRSLAYRITVSCPSPKYPDEPSRPAELGNSYTQESYHQRATKVGQAELKKQIIYPAPETDEVNGVTGKVSMSWDLKR